MKNHIICVGNPGTGKSTILNSLLETVDPGKQYERFKSGVSIARGLTYELNTVVAGDTEYMDTPGLADVKLRKQAAQAIHDALKKGGIFQVIVVVTLESGRVKPDDAATVKLVLDSAPDIKEFGVIFNKVTKGVKRALEKNSNGISELLVEIQPQSNTKTIAYPLCLMKRDDLEDEEDICMVIPDLKSFQDALPCIKIIPEHVKAIKDDKFDEMKELMEKQLEALRQDKEMMRKQMEEMQERLNKAIENSSKGGVISNFFRRIGL